MVAQARRGMPTPPIELESGAPTRARFARRAVAVPDAVVRRLCEVCPHVATDVATRVEAGRDWWPLSVGWALAGEVPAEPPVVVRPESEDEVTAVLAVCHDAGVPVTAMGGRSGVGGHAVPVFGGVAVDMTGLSGIAAVDATSLLADVAAGTFGDVLEDGLRAHHRLTLGHWPQSMALSTVGGWVACRSAGQYSTRYGKIEDMVSGLRVALADGRLMSTGGHAPRSATGPDLTQLFVGSEGTLGVITKVRLRVHHLPAVERRLAYRFETFASGIEACRAFLQRGATPAVVRLYDEWESRSSFGAQAGCALIVLDEGDGALVDAGLALVTRACRAAGGQVAADDLVERWYQRRLDVSALETAVRAGLVADTIEVAGGWRQLPSVYDEVVAAVRAVDGTLAVSAHLSHAYPDGACLYFTFAGQPAAGTGSAAAADAANVADAADGYYRRVWDLVMAVVMSHGGSISHHHGVGLNRARFLPQALGPAFDVLAAIKSALDPRGILNPGKLGLPSAFGEVPWP